MVVSTCGRYSVVVCSVDIGATRVFLTEHSADIWVQEDRDEGVAEVNASQSLPNDRNKIIMHIKYGGHQMLKDKPTKFR